MAPHGRQGAARVVAVSGAAAAAGVEHPLPGVEQFRVHAVTFKLTTAAGVANRRPVLELLDSSGTAVAAVAAPFTLSAGKTSTFTFGAGLQQFGANDAEQIGGPFVAGWLAGNLTIGVTVAAAQAGDAIADVRLLLEQREPGPTA